MFTTLSLNLSQRTTEDDGSSALVALYVFVGLLLCFIGVVMFFLFRFRARVEKDAEGNSGK